MSLKTTFPSPTISTFRFELEIPLYQWGWSLEITFTSPTISTFRFESEIPLYQWSWSLEITFTSPTISTFRFESLSKTKEKHEAEMEPLTKVNNLNDEIKLNIIFLFFVSINNKLDDRKLDSR